MTNNFEDLIMKNRNFLKDSIRKSVDFSKTEQNNGVVAPPVQKPYPEDAAPINLVVEEDWEDIYKIPLARAIKNRISHRNYTGDPLTQKELSFLLWATQGVRLVEGGNTFRNVPSAGCRHAMETYMAVFNVEGLEKGIYRYLPLTHQLVLEFTENELNQKVINATFGQQFAGLSAVTFIYTAIPHRMEWRYGPVSHKVIAMDAGHAGQNLYLACEAINSGTCVIGAYDQEYADKLLRVDGDNEFVIYLAPVGKVDLKEF
jgi:SagB-type dehydrogenase family enzyme